MSPLDFSPAEVVEMYRRRRLRPAPGDIRPANAAGCCAMGAILVDRCDLAPESKYMSVIEPLLEEHFRGNRRAVAEFESGFDMGIMGCRRSSTAGPNTAHGIAVGWAVRQAFGCKFGRAKVRVLVTLAVEIQPLADPGDIAEVVLGIAADVAATVTERLDVSNGYVVNEAAVHNVVAVH